MIKKNIGALLEKMELDVEKKGDMCTPTGTFGLGPVYIRKDKITKLKTKIQTYPIFKNMYWEDDPKSKNYNKLSFNSKYSRVFV